MNTLSFRCDICGESGGVVEMRERELVGKLRKICTDCDEHIAGE